MEIYTTLVGASFRPAAAKAVIKALSVGDHLTLSLDPENEYDDNAVCVLAGDTFIGFVARKDNPPIAEALREGAEPSVEIVAFENSLRPVLEIVW